MAVDPNSPEEVKRRERQREQPWTRQGTARFADEIPMSREVAPDTRQNRVQVQLIDPAQRSAGSGTDRRGAGLTRIVRTGDGVYTDAPDAQGDVRYYGALGQRADVGTPQGITRNTSVADYNAAERASAFDLSTPAGQARLFENAERQRRGLGRMLADNAAIASGNDPGNPRQLEWVTDPETGQRTVMSRNEREFRSPGLATARAATAQANSDLAQTRLAAQIANQQAQAGARDRGLDLRERQMRAQLSRNEDGSINPAYIRENLGALLPGPEGLAEFFQTDEGRYTQTLLEEQLRQTEASEAPFTLGLRSLTRRPSFNFGDLQETPWWRGGDSGFIPAGDERVGGIVNPDNLGITPQQLQDLIEYYRQTNPSPAG